MEACDSAARPLAVVCCFCGHSLLMAKATQLIVAPVDVEDEQVLYCHGRCLAERVAPSVPLLVDQDD